MGVSTSIPLLLMPTPNPFVSSSKPVNVVGKIYPDGTCGWSNEREVTHAPVNGSDLIDSPSVDEAFDRRFAKQFGVEELRAAKEKEPTLGLSNVINSPSDSKKRSPRGSTGLTSHGRKLIRNGAGYLEWRFGRRHLSFATVTLPGITAIENAQVTEEWGAIVKTFIKNIGRKLNDENLPTWITGCYEIQPQRAKESGIAVLHFHFVFVGRRPRSGWAITPREIRSAWRSAVISRVPSIANRDFAACEHVVRIQRSVAAYLSKYISKIKQCVGDVATLHGAGYPSSWYACSLQLRRIVCRSVRSGRHVGEFLSTLDERFFLYRQRIECTDSSGYRFTVGWYGVLRLGWSEHLDVPIHVPIEESNRNVSQFPLPKVYSDGYSYIAINVPANNIVPVPVSNPGKSLPSPF